MNPHPNSGDLQSALWANRARRLRNEAIPALSRILDLTISPDHFTDLAEYRSTLCNIRGSDLTEERFPKADRAGAIRTLETFPALGEPGDILLLFCRSREIGCLRLARCPTAEAIFDLVDWDQDDVYGFSFPSRLLFHVELCEDYLDSASRADRRMIYIVRKVAS